ncbi:MAG: hypothetical protein KAS58_07420, partial [Calditrichia bacterium]|nr:hypothetical protein [Calditrichia bacterium]
MTHIKYSYLYKYTLLLSLIIPFLNPVIGQSSQIKSNPNIYTFSGSRNNHSVKNISMGWEIITPEQNLSVTVNLPILAPRDINRITFSKTFQIPDSLRKRKLIIWFPGIGGKADININNIQVLQRLNFPSGFKIQIPM